MERRRGANDRDYEDRARKPRRKRKPGGALLWVFAILAVVVLVGAGVGVGVVLHLRSNRPSPAGDTRLNEASGRLLGKWEGGSPERPSVKVFLEVTRDRIRLQGMNVRTNEQGKVLTYSWNPVSVSGNTLVVQRQEVEGEKRDIQWSIRFASEDEMSVTSLADGVLLANFKRIGK